MKKAICFFLFLLFAVEKAYSLNQIKILSMNVGGAQFTIRDGLKIKPICPFFKLCDSEIIERVRKHILTYSPDVILFQEILDPSQLKASTSKTPSLLPNSYEFFCGKGAGGVQEVCIAWDQSKLSLKSPCVSLHSQESGAVKCSLQVQDSDIEFISVHPSAWHRLDRETFLQRVWSGLVDSKKPTVIGGDFNTDLGTYKDQKPYPPNFGTIFGRMLKGYGRWPSRQDLYGHIIQNEKDGNSERTFRGSTIFWGKIDHIFANFGGLPSRGQSQTMPCGYHACLGNYDKYEWGPAKWTLFNGFGPKIDHLPILVLLKWQAKAPFLMDLGSN